MIYVLTRWLYQSEWLQGFDTALDLLRPFRYLSVRSIFAALTALAISLAFGDRFIRALKRAGAVDQVWQYGVLDVEGKRGTPSMGGVLILLACLTSAVLWCDVRNRFVWIAMLSGLYFGLLGCLDDLRKIRRRSGAKGLSRGLKYAAQVLFGVGIAAVYLDPQLSPASPEVASCLFVPCVKDPVVDLGWYYLFVIVLFTVASSNSVNLTDGMDGLAIVPATFSAAVLGIFAYLIGNMKFASYLHFPFMAGSGELAVLASAVAGAGVGFLWFNAYPATIFMGDTGSLALGGMLGTIALLVKQEGVFFIVGGVFVMEVASSFLQDYIGLRIFGRRILFRAPLHYSFLHQGTAESKIAVRFWIIAGIFSLVALATLKIR